jgi:adenylate cyclase
VIGGIIVMAAHDIVMSHYYLTSDLTIVYNFFLVSTLASGAAVTYLLEGLFRSEFLKTKELHVERTKANNLVNSVFPPRIAQRLESGDTTTAESHDEATILFSDLVGFTNLTRRLAPGHLVEVLTNFFGALASRLRRHLCILLCC